MTKYLRLFLEIIATIPPINLALLEIVLLTILFGEILKPKVEDKVVRAYTCFSFFAVTATCYLMHMYA